MLKDEILSKNGITYIILACIFMLVLLLYLWGLHFNGIWSLLIIFPMLLLVDLCFFTLPVTIPALFILSAHVLIKKDYEKYIPAFNILIMAISCGILNMLTDTLMNEEKYFMEYYGWKFILFLLCLVLLYYSLKFISKFKDNRIHIYVYVTLLAICLLNQLINIIE